MSDREIHKLQNERATLKAKLAALKGDAAVRWRGALPRLLADRRIRLALAAAVVAIPLAADAATIFVPYTFVNGTVADATEVNANFNTLVLESNAQDSRITAHTGDTGNPHSVSTGQIGAATVGQHAAHTGDTGNPHSVSTGQIGAATVGQHAAHTSDTGNPHSVSAAQVGAATPADLSAHAADSSAHHTPYTDPDAVAAILASDGSGSGLDGDMVDGLHGADLALVGHSHTSTVTMGRIYLTGDGTILTTRSGTNELYWDYDFPGGHLELRNTGGDWLDYWWQSQKGTTMAGRSNALAGSSTFVIEDLTSNNHGAQIHFGQADGQGGWCSVWLQYANGVLVGHYIKY
jgi:hypothetical protein